MQDADVLIVGAGPVGTALALELALHKVSFRIIDRDPVRSDKSRALVVQPRTLELLNRHGAAQGLISRGRIAHGAAFFVNRKLVTKLNLDDLGTTDTEFPLPLMISQVQTEHFLDECLAKYGIRVERPVVAKDIVQDDDAVTATLEMPGGNIETARFKYAVGCDGAHSVVRHKATNLTFEGAAYAQDFILCDAHIRDSCMPQDRFSACLGSGMVAFFPLGDGIVRVIASGNNMTADKGEPQLEHFQKFLEDFAPEGCGTLYDPVWMTRFHLHHRGVNNYRDRRLFVAGDAAHIHSPAGGQGMNTGIQDSINLGWKLAAVLHGRAEEKLLESYNAERFPVGQTLLKGSDKMFSLGTSTNPIFTRLRNFLLPHILPWVTASPSRRLSMFQFLSEFGITYREESPIVGTARDFGGPVKGGDRLPDGKLKNAKGEETSVQGLCVGAPHHLLLFAGGEENTAATTETLEDVRDKVQELVKSEVETHIMAATNPSSATGEATTYTDVDATVHAQFGFTKSPGYVFVRPDGYVAHIGFLSNLGELLAFLKA
ncbi:putative aromatic compound monooxygenase YhjG [Diplogelasinospora grovesii]|uniref:Aromatic compound monooxygenase YhjG n=1 Tax=Diplogelasinospora grovesii TaxID=303347 RepID=A0AAN6NAR4_9PEZI|nr:putative aromatic compound monooxygenase YhjG [Diplogelasinospora grovesii]